MSVQLTADFFQQSVELLNPKPVLSLNHDALVRDVINKIQENKLGSIILTKDNAIYGIITENDFLLKMGSYFEDCKDQPASDFATVNPMTLTFSSTVEECLTLMTGFAIRHVPIVKEEDGSIYMVSIRDVLGFITNNFKDELKYFGVVLNPLIDGVYHPDENILEDSANEESLINESLFSITLNRLVSSKFIKVDINDDIANLIEVMQSRLYTVAIVVEYETTIKGIITERDLLQKVFNRVDFNSKSYKVQEFMTPNPHCLFENHAVAHAVNNMFKFNYRNMILMNRDKYPLSVIGLNDILYFLVRGLELDTSFDIIREKNNIA